MRLAFPITALISVIRGVVVGIALFPLMLLEETLNYEQEEE